METVKKGRRRINQAALDRIKEAGRDRIIIQKKDWKLKTPPGMHILRKYLKAEYRVQSLVAGGWVVKKV